MSQTVTLKEGPAKGIKVEIHYGQTKLSGFQRIPDKTHGYEERFDRADYELIDGEWKFVGLATIKDGVQCYVT